MSDHRYAYYSSYTSAAFDDDSKYDVLHLRCPKCGAEEIEIVGELAPAEYIPRMLGDRARCWMCKHEFTVTENCWRPAKAE